MDFAKELQERIKKAQARKEAQNQEAVEKLLDNTEFIEAQREIAAKEQELEKLNTVITQLNNIAPFVTKDGRRFSINVFPVPVFGTGAAQVIGIINGSRGAFVDEKLLEYAAISGITTLELIEAREALGSPAYYKDGKVVEAAKGDFGKLKTLLQGIYLKMGLTEFKVDDVTKEKYDLWYALSEAKAHRQLAEHEELQLLEEGAKDFVIES